MSGLKPGAIALVWALATAGDAGAATNRAWVSGHGVDQAGCGALTAPCRSLQYAHDNAVSAGGEIDILDPAGYGALTITKSISIVNDGVGAAGVQASNGAAITISAARSDRVYLKGLEIDGLAGSGGDGVLLNSGYGLLIVDCEARGFQGAGVTLRPSDIFAVTILRTVSAGNGAGVKLIATGTASGSLVIDQSSLVGNAGQGGQFAGTVAPASANVTLVNSQASHNSVGVVVQGPGALGLEVVNSRLEGNTGDGLLAQGASHTHITRSIIDQNGQYGIVNQAVVASARDNRVADNGAGATTGPAVQTDTLR